MKSIKSELISRVSRFRLKRLSTVSLERLILDFRGKSVRARIGQRDLPLFHPSLHSKCVLFIGGHKGRMPGALLHSVPSIELMDIYEPLPEFAEQIEATFSKEVLAGRVRVFQEAIVASGQTVEMLRAGDHSAVDGIGRNLTGLVMGYSTCLAVQLESAVGRMGPVWSLIMNCEGSEYSVIEQLGRFGTDLLPTSIIVQFHVNEPDPFGSLYKARMSLTRHFTPITTCDFAWDIWIRNDLSPFTAQELERLPLSGL